ncbi:MAG: dATP/dGTP diphosphohydrolase domain-containing protein [Candidatus Binatia bacterium]
MNPMRSFPDEDKARKRLPMWTYITQYFPKALMAELGVAVAGNEQHNPGEPLHWAREKSTDQMNTAFHHMWDHCAGKTKDTDGQYHLAKAIWRLKAELELTIEAEEQAEKKPGGIRVAIECHALWSPAFRPGLPGDDGDKLCVWCRHPNKEHDTVAPAQPSNHMRSGYDTDTNG